jgi:nucleotide-binding universal stress UspA family protein
LDEINKSSKLKRRMKILICSDGSEQAERAIQIGATIAAGSGAHVTLLGIVETPPTSETIQESLKRAQALLAARQVQTELVTKPGEPVGEILKCTEETGYELVVIGAVRKGARGRFWMSSKTYKIIKQIKPPVLMVAGKSDGIQRVLICSGGRRHIDSAVRLTAQIARSTGATVTLLHVMAQPPAIYAGLRRMEESATWLLNSPSELGLNLRHEKEALEGLGVPTEVRLRRGSVIEQILREIERGNYELVVTGSALSRSLRTYVLGDITREIVNRAHCAVLVVRSQEKPGESGSGLLSWWSRLTPG